MHIIFTLFGKISVLIFASKVSASKLYKMCGYIYKVRYKHAPGTITFHLPDIKYELNCKDIVLSDWKQDLHVVREATAQYAPQIHNYLRTHWVHTTDIEQIHITHKDFII